MNVKGMSIQDIIDIDINDIVKMKAKDLRQISSRLVSASNKRMRRLKSDKNGWGELSPSLTSHKEQFSIANKTRQQVLREYKQMKIFLTSKTSTLRGWKKVRKTMQVKIGGSITSEQYKDFWSTYRKFEEMNKGGMMAVQYMMDQSQNGTAKGKPVSERMMQFLREKFVEGLESMSFDEVMNQMNEFLDNYYKTGNPMKSENDEDDTDGFDIPF